MSHNAIGLLKANGEIEEYGSTAGGGGGDTSTLANKTDLTAIILTGTTNTSGDTITAGTWFYLNGTLVKAKADIANGATFTENTNYEAKTVGDELSELNSKIPSGGGSLSYFDVDLADFTMNWVKENPTSWYGASIDISSLIPSGAHNLVSATLSGTGWYWGTFVLVSNTYNQLYLNSPVNTIQYASSGMKVRVWYN